MRAVRMMYTVQAAGSSPMFGRRFRGENELHQRFLGRRLWEPPLRAGNVSGRKPERAIGARELLQRADFELSELVHLQYTGHARLRFYIRLRCCLCAHDLTCKVRLAFFATRVSQSWRVMEMRTETASRSAAMAAPLPTIHASWYRKQGSSARGLDSHM